MDENDTRETANKSKKQIDKLISDTNKKLQNINKRLKESLRKLSDYTSSRESTSRNIPVNESED